MALIEIIPAIDIIEGKCVRLSQGDYSKKIVYNQNPLEVAQMFVNHGIRRLHLVDLDGAKAGSIINYRVLETIAGKTNLSIDFGGGLKSNDDLRIAFECGAEMVTGGSIAVKNRDVFTSWVEKYGSEKIILGADVKDEKIAVSGWTETSDLELIDFVKDYVNRGITKVICTDISKDGMLQGPATELYKKILNQFSELHLVASGGVSCIDDIDKLIEAKVPAVITGKAIYEGKIELNQLEKYA